MPTGYTAGIIDGEITTFQQFAKLCARAFGATMHMRDDSLKEEYKPSVPSDYYTKEIKKATKLLSDSKHLSDEELIKRRIEELTKDKLYHVEAMKKNDISKLKMEEILSEATAWVPPTEEHEGIKKFMIEQIYETIKHDCGNGYHITALGNIEDELKTMTSESIRAAMKTKAYKDLSYNSEKHEQEVKRCDASNQWVAEYFKSIGL